jgi:ABC-type uncharacterized transport system fused permease/ATPase subunit
MEQNPYNSPNTNIVDNTPKNASNTKKIIGISGCILLPIILVIMITIPAIFGNRNAARDYYTYSQMRAQIIELCNRYDQTNATMNNSYETIHQLREYLNRSASTNPNPWDFKVPAFSNNIVIATNLTPDQIKVLAQKGANTLGQSNFVIQLPSDGNSGYIAGSCRLIQGRHGQGKTPVDISPLNDTSALESQLPRTELNPPKPVQ